MAPRRITAQEIDELRMPPSTFGGDPRGMVDPAALLAASWGTEYDVDARRDAIAKALLAQQAAAAAAAAAPVTPREAAGMGIRPFDYKDTAPGTSSGDSPAATGREPGNVTQRGFFENAVPNREWDADKPPAPPSGRRAFDPEDVPEPPADVPPSPPPDVPVAPPADVPDPDATPTPAPSTTTTTPAPDRSTWGGGLPSMQGDQFAHGAPPAGNLFEGTPGFTNFGGVVTPAPGGYPGEHSDIPGATTTNQGGKGDKQGQGNVLTDNPAAVPNAPALSVPSPVMTPTDTPVTTTPVAPDAVPGNTIPGAHPATPSFSPAAAATPTGGKSLADQLAEQNPGFTPAANTMPAPSDYDFTAPDPGKGPFDPGGPGYSPAAAAQAGAQTGRDYGGYSGRGGFGLADLAEMAANAPGAPGSPMGGFDVGGPGRGMSEGAMAAAAQAAADAALGNPSGSALADQAGLGDIGGKGGPGSGMSEGAMAAAQAAADAALSAPGGQSLADQAGLSDIGASPAGGPGMGMSEGAMAAAAQAAADAVAEGAGDPSGDGNGNGDD